MNRILKGLAVIVLMVCLQMVVYSFFIEPYTHSWGASKAEVNMTMSGDSLAPSISSTRAITINAPVMTVWYWIIQLGADRGGFFSYTFIENALGYEGRIPGKPFPEFTEMTKERVIPGAIDGNKPIIDYSWPVLLVEPGKSFVLKNWGAFEVAPIDDERTRLIVRTHGRDPSTIMERIRYFFIMPLHYIMERRMLVGFKSCAETGQHLSSVPDAIWFLGIVLSFAGLILLAFIANGIQRFYLSGGLGLLWLLPLLIVAPSPVYSLPMLVIVIVVNAMLLLKNRHPPLTN